MEVCFGKYVPLKNTWVWVIQARHLTDGRFCLAVEGEGSSPKHAEGSVCLFVSSDGLLITPCPLTVTCGGSSVGTNIRA